ncbi:MAG: amino acid adenylation domain-containing protein [Actinomycetota bacterium]
MTGGRLLHELLEGDAVDPDAEAVTDGRHSLTGAQLVDRCARFGALLADAGVRPGDRVGVHLHCSTAAMVAVHGTLRAGGVVVPLDPDAPGPHLGGLIERCDVGVVATEAPTARLAPLADAGVTTFVGGGAVDGARTVPWDALDAVGPSPPADLSEDDPAYIIWTSGSTGRPKGIVHTHRSARRYAELTVDTYDLGPGDRIASSAPLHFDQSTFDLYAGPAAGATTVMIPAPVLRFPASVTQVLADERITAWYSVPSLLVQLHRRGALDERDLGALRWVLFGGEVYPAGQLAAMMELLPDARFSNVYGPAEVNQCTYHHLDAPPAADEIVPIGEAWDDTELLVVDRDGRPTAHAPGELLVRTATAMRGYWDDPATTHAAFRTVDGHGDRWYATGDLVERRDDGALVFLGRRDHQVKIRGHRVELEAVESVLLDQAGVTEAAVLPERHDDGDRLVGLVVGDARLEGRTLVGALRGLLPGYAVPARIVRVDHLPRTSTAKIDRSAASALLRELDGAADLLEIR